METFVTPDKRMEKRTANVGVSANVFQSISMLVSSSIMKNEPKRALLLAKVAPAAARKRRLRGESLSIERNFLREYEKILRENHGQLPERKTLKAQGHGDWLNELYRRENSLNWLRKISGQAPSRYDGEDSKRKMKNLVPRLRKMMESNGFTILPDSKWDGWKGKYSPERDAISWNGGLNKLREVVGPARLGAPAIEYYKDWENAKEALLEIVEKKCWLPPLEHLMHNPKYELIIKSVYAFHGNWWQVRMRMEQEGLAPAAYKHSESKGKPLSDPEVALKIARKLAEKNNGAVPGAKKLKKMGLWHLASPITVNGGCKRLKEIIRAESASDGKMVETVVL